MANTTATTMVPAPEATLTPAICPQCHQPIMPSYYFCPNCGKKLEDAPLSTTVWAQLWLYTFSLIIMPITCYLVYGKWQGIKYFKSKDTKEHRVGVIAVSLLIISVILLVWFTWEGTLSLERSVQEQINSAGNLGGF